MDDSGEDRKYAIVVEGYEEPVGFTALYGLFRQTAPELGALIGDDVRGKGVGRRAEALTLAKAFDEFGAHRVYGRIPARNEVAKKTVAGSAGSTRARCAPTCAATARSTTARSGGCSRRVPGRGGGPDRRACAQRARAELLADGGAAARTRSSSARAPSSTPKGSRTRCGSSGEGELLAPADRPRDPSGGPELDAISPYGYPGVAADGSARRGREARSTPTTIDFPRPGWSAIFLRHALGAPAARRRRRAQRGPDRRPRACRRRAAAATASRSAATCAADTRSRSCPARRRRRASARASSPPTSRRCAAPMPPSATSSAPPTSTASSRRSAPGSRSRGAPAGEIAAASIAALSDGFLHYYLSGSADSHLRDSPMKNVVAALIDLAAEPGLPLNLGGGISPGDRLEEFKRGFANRELCLAHLGDRLRPGRLRTPKRGARRRLLPRLPRRLRLAAHPSVRSGSAPRPKALTGSPPNLPQVALPKSRMASRVIAPLYSLQPSRFVQVVAATA